MFFCTPQTIYYSWLDEGPEGVKWELGFAYFLGGKMGFHALHGTGIHQQKNNRKWD